MGMPRWLTDYALPVPAAVQAGVERFGADIRAGKIGRERIAAALGCTEYRAQMIVTVAKQDREPDIGPGFLAGIVAKLQAKNDVADMQIRPGTSSAVEPAPDFPIPPLDPHGKDEAAQPIEELLAERAARFERKQAGQAGCHTINLTSQRAIMVTILGDPHIDDDGANVGLLMRTVATVAATEGAYLANIGDTTNGAWPGRLTKLWANQSTTMPEQIRLARWLYHSADYLFCVLGNHDKWGEYGAALHRYLTAGAKIRVMEPDQARIELVWPDGETFRIVARHNFPGRSMWNICHAPARWAKLVDQGWGDLYVQGHIHSNGRYTFEVGGKPITALVVRGYKEVDAFASGLGFQRYEHGASATLVLDPAAEPMDRCRLFYDVDAAARYLTYLRGA